MASLNERIRKAKVGKIFDRRKKLSTGDREYIKKCEYPIDTICQAFGITKMWVYYLKHPDKYAANKKVIAARNKRIRAIDKDTTRKNNKSCFDYRKELYEKNKISI